MIAYVEKILLQKELKELERKIFDDTYTMTPEDYARYEYLGSLGLLSHLDECL